MCIVDHKARANAPGGRKDEEQEAGDRPRGAATRQGTRARAPTKSDANRDKPRRDCISYCISSVYLYQGIRILMDQNINISGYHVSICTMHLSLAPKSRTSKY